MQGSITSTLLCSLYFADLEARYLRPVLPNHPNHPLGLPPADTAQQQRSAAGAALCSRSSAHSFELCNTPQSLAAALDLQLFALV